MLASSYGSGQTGSWQRMPFSLTEAPMPLRPPTNAVAMSQRAQMPSSNYSLDYGLGYGRELKIAEEQGRTRVVSSFAQGFCGRAVERYGTGETYVGSFANGRRHGHGMYVDRNGDRMVSFFKAGAPVGEGVLLPKKMASTERGFVRTFEGRADDAIGSGEAVAIAQNLRVSSPERMIGIPAAPKPPLTPTTPPIASKQAARAWRAAQPTSSFPKPAGPSYMPNWYKTTSQEATASRKVLEEAAAARLPSRDVFLARLAEAEKAD